MILRLQAGNLILGSSACLYKFLAMTDARGTHVNLTNQHSQRLGHHCGACNNWPRTTLHPTIGREAELSRRGQLRGRKPPGRIEMEAFSEANTTKSSYTTRALLYYVANNCQRGLSIDSLASSPLNSLMSMTSLYYQDSKYCIMRLWHSLPPPQTRAALSPRPHGLFGRRKNSGKSRVGMCVKRGLCCRHTLGACRH